MFVLSRDAKVESYEELMTPEVTAKSHNGAGFTNLDYQTSEHKENRCNILT